MKSALLLALPLRIMSTCCDIPAETFSLNFLQRALMDRDDGNCYLEPPLVPVIWYTGSTGKEAAVNSGSTSLVQILARRGEHVRKAL